jgi:hypothetical protein
MGNLSFKTQINLWPPGECQAAKSGSLPVHDEGRQGFALDVSTTISNAWAERMIASSIGCRLESFFSLTGATRVYAPRENILF